MNSIRVTLEIGPKGKKVAAVAPDWPGLERGAATGDVPIQRLLDQGGDRAVTFGSVAETTGLAPPTLVQRYQSRDGMVRAARLAFWDALDHRTAEAIAGTADKGPQGLLKAIGPVAAGAIAVDLRDPDLASWPHCQQFGAARRAAGSSGLLYRSVRRDAGECIAAFRPRAVSRPVQGRHLRYVWDGQRIANVYALSEVHGA